MVNTHACEKSMHCLEDRYMRMPGLYTMWTALYVAVVSSMAVSDVTGPSRDFLMITSGISTIFPAFASVDLIYGNAMPSSLLLVGGPIYQYVFWQLLCYYRGDVYGSDAIGVMNLIGTIVTSVFTLDMVLKTWYYTFYPKRYKEYVGIMKSE
tara:strand:- start:1976 stop:2431 length:456 start_codon:yes stop_codon:yes gene_type:complete